MKVVVQLVRRASVSIDEQIVSSIGKGYLLLVGLTPGDDMQIAKKMADKIVKLRVFPDEDGKTNLSLSQVGGSILSVSQFTLYGSVQEGNRPSFVSAMRPDEARVLYEEFYSYLKKLVPSLQGGVFQSNMVVSLENEGPFTLVLDSKELFEK